MSEMGYKARWLVSQTDLNVGTRFHGKPVGNFPEFMPLDNSLNVDVKRAHECHVTAALHLPIDDN